MRRAQRYKKNADAVARLHKKLAAQEAKLTRLHEEHEVRMLWCSSWTVY